MKIKIYQYLVNPPFVLIMAFILIGIFKYYYLINSFISSQNAHSWHISQTYSLVFTSICLDHILSLSFYQTGSIGVISHPLGIHS